MPVSKEVLVARKELDRLAPIQNRLEGLFEFVLKAANVKFTLYGEDKIPKDEPVVLMATHKAGFLIDAPALGYVYRRHTDIPITAAMKSEFDERLLLGPLLRYMGGKPVGRTPETFNREQIETLINVARAGGTVAVMSEGGLNSREDVGELKRGAAFIARMAGVDVVTVGIYSEGDPFSYDLRDATVFAGSRTNPRDFGRKEIGPFYQMQLQSSYEISKGLHTGEISLIQLLEESDPRPLKDRAAEPLDLS